MLLKHVSLYVCLSYVFDHYAVCPNKVAVCDEKPYTFFLKIFPFMTHIYPYIHLYPSIGTLSVYLSICFVHLTVMQFVLRVLPYQPDTFQSQTNSVPTLYLQSHNGNCPLMPRPPLHPLEASGEHLYINDGGKDCCRGLENRTLGAVKRQPCDRQRQLSLVKQN